MTITLGPDVETALTEAARRRGTTPEALAVESLRAIFVTANGSELSEEEFEDLVKELDEAFEAAGGNKIPPLSDYGASRESFYKDHL